MRGIERARKMRRGGSPGGGRRGATRLRLETLGVAVLVALLDEGSPNLGRPSPGHPGLEVKANRIGGYLACIGNSPAVSDAGRPNTVRGWIVFG